MTQQLRICANCLYWHHNPSKTRETASGGDCLVPDSIQRHTQFYDGCGWFKLFQAGQTESRVACPQCHSEDVTMRWFGIAMFAGYTCKSCNHTWEP